MVITSLSKLLWGCIWSYS